MRETLRRTAIVCAVLAGCLGATYAAATLALMRPDFWRIDAALASQLKADYSADPHDAPMRAPVDPAIVEAARQDEQALRSATPPDAGAPPASGIEPAATPTHASDGRGDSGGDGEPGQPGASATPKPQPTRTPEPTRTPKPETTPEPVDSATPAPPEPTDTPRPKPTETPIRCDNSGPGSIDEEERHESCHTATKTPTKTPKPKPEPTATPTPLIDCDELLPGEDADDLCDIVDLDPILD